MSNSLLVTDGTLNEQSNEEEGNVQLPLATEHLEAFTVSVRVLHHRGVLNSDNMGFTMSCQRALKSGRSLNMAQGDIRSICN